MKFLGKKSTRFSRDIRGATAVEYGLIAALIAVIITASLGITGINVGSLYGITFGQISGSIENANDG